MTQRQGQPDQAQPAADAPRPVGGVVAMMVLCGVVAAVSLFLTFCLDQSSVTTVAGELTTITVAKTQASNVVTYVLMGSLLAVLFLSASASRRKRRLVSALGVVGVVAAVGVWAFGAVQRFWDPPWYVVGQVQAVDGNDYAYLEYNMLQAQRLVIGVKQSEVGVRTTYKVLGETNSDSPRSWVAVVRPAECGGSAGRLLQSPDGWLVGLRYANACYFAYNPATGEYLAHDDVAKISPLILMGPGSVPLEADVREILAARTGRSPARPGGLWRKCGPRRRSSRTRSSGNCSRSR